MAGIFYWQVRRPGKEIGHANADIIREAAKHHEVGLHARITMHGKPIAVTGIGKHWSTILHAAFAPEEIIGQPVTCSAAAGWRADQQVIEAKEAFHLRYNSDCRGAMPFRPLLESGNPGTAQIPVTLPTWDEVIGRDVKAEDFNGWLLNRILRDKGMPVYTIHAEVEGCAYQHNFVDLLKRAAQEGVTFCPLSELLSGTLPLGQVVRGNIAGREGWLGCQQIAGSR
ncbi:hypothetical protein ECZU20_00320 [Escherichia coli]|nr:hypothetical protein ECZU20_00320 [Escherichia coli]